MGGCHFLRPGRKPAWHSRGAPGPFLSLLGPGSWDPLHPSGPPGPSWSAALPNLNHGQPFPEFKASKISAPSLLPSPVCRAELPGFRFRGRASHRRGAEARFTGLLYFWMPSGHGVGVWEDKCWGPVTSESWGTPPRARSLGCHGDQRLEGGRGHRKLCPADSRWPGQEV